MWSGVPSRRTKLTLYKAERRAKTALNRATRKETRMKKATKL